MAQDVPCKPVPNKTRDIHEFHMPPNVTFKRCHQPHLLRMTGLSALACGSTAIIQIVSMLIHGASVEKPCFSKFPVCDPISLQTQMRLPSSFRQCETLLLVLAIAILIHWLCLSTLFQEEQWRERYLPLAVIVVGGVTMMAGLMTKDPAVLFIQILPAIADVCAIVCICLDDVRHEPKLRREGLGADPQAYD